MAIKANLVIDQGTTFNAAIDLIDASGQVYDLSGHLVASQMRKNFASSSAVTFTCSHNDTGGKIFLALTADETSAIAPGRYLYDVEITSSANTVIRVVEGVITVTPSMTRI